MKTLHQARPSAIVVVALELFNVLFNNVLNRSFCRQSSQPIT